MMRVQIIVLGASCPSPAARKLSFRPFPLTIEVVELVRHSLGPARSKCLGLLGRPRAIAPSYTDRGVFGRLYDPRRTTLSCVAQRR